MAIGEIFVPRMPHLYKMTGQLLRNRQDFEDNLHADTISTPQLSRQFHGHHKLSTWLHGTIGKVAAMRFAQTSMALLRHAGLRHLK